MLTPRTRRLANTRTAALPAPAWTFELLTGQDPKCRLHGWPQLYLTGEPSAAEVWAQHSEALLEEAQANGFEAFWPHQRTPTGPAFERWRAAFLAAHRY